MINRIGNFIHSMGAVKGAYMAGTGIASIDSGLNILKTVSVGLISGIGIIIVAWAGFEIGMALYQHDTAQIPGSLKKVAGGLVMIGIGVFIGLFAA